MSTFQDLLEDIRQIRVVDAHAHVISHDQCQPMDSVMDLLMEPYIGYTMGFASRDSARIIQDRSVPDSQRWEEFVSIWPAWRTTGYGLVVAGTLREWGLDSDRLAVDMYSALRERVQSRGPEMSRDAYANAGIDASISHYIGMPHFGRLETVRSYLNGTLHIDDGFFPQLGSPPLHEFPNRREVEIMSSIVDVDIVDLTSLVEAVDTMVERCVKTGIVGFKEHRAYTMGLAYGVPDRHAAQRDLDAVLAGEEFQFGPRALSDFMFDRVVQLAAAHQIPIAVHTGYRQLDVDEGANLAQMRRIFDEYPDVVFDIYHINYPYAEDHLAIIKSYPNLYANTCWTHIIDPAYTVEFLKSAIGAIPANHVFGFGSDFAVLPEAAVAHLEIARVNIAEALSWAIDRRMISRYAALELATMWLADNPRSVYKLP
jgi:predicted TIM-barrel fold metal-dependent hydrolase